MTRIEREKLVVAKMVRLYCRRKLGLAEPTPEYVELLEYAHAALRDAGSGRRKLRASAVRCIATSLPCVPK